MRVCTRAMCVILCCVGQLVFLYVPASAQGSSDRIAAEDVFELELAIDPQISPDGDRIVYVRQFGDIMTDKRYTNLWMINSDGTDHRPLTTGKFSDSAPRWSPDGTRLLYISNRDGTSQLYVRWMDTGQTVKVTNLARRPGSPAWSPDGQWIAFTSFVPDTPPVIAAMPARPPGAEWAPPARVIDRLHYRQDGAGYLKPGYTHLFVVPSEGGTPRQISSGNFQHGGSGSRASRPVWTPDGRFLLLSMNRRADYEHDPVNTEIYEFSVADGSVRALTDRNGPDNSPAISPDGRRIAYIGFDDRYQGYQVRRLYVMDRDGTGARVLSGTLDRSVGSHAWASDGSGLYCVYDDHGNTKLAFIGLSGTVDVLAANLGAGVSSYAGGAQYSVARNGTFAFTYTRPDIPGDIAVGRTTDRTVRVITGVNEDLLGYKTLGSLEEIRYPSSLDGREIQGWILTPPDFDSGKKYPLILEIHGGPFANYGDRFDIEKQVWAAKGYVVLYVNPRGSTSYGGEFGNLIHHRYPGDDFYDLNAGVDAVIARGYIDADNLFVTGGSGGGILTCWMIGRTGRFRAAAPAYPVINWSSWVLTADMYAYGVKYWFPGPPWDHPEHYESRSLLSVVRNVTTPTMIITGEEDYRTPMSESEQYYQALQLLRVESALVRVPGEPHGVRRRPSHHVSKILHILGWFERHRQKGTADGQR